MQLTERDIEILKFINEFGFCDMRQLMERFGLKKTWMYDIMKRLIMMKLAKHIRVFHNRHGVFSVTAKGADYTDLPAIDRVSLGQYEHQITILNVYIKLKKKFPESHWISERRLKHDKFFDGIGKRGHISDGILILSEEMKVAIEVELSVKGKNRIEKILKTYRAQIAISEVWYFCSPSVINVLKSLSSKMPFVKIFPLREFLHGK